VEQKTASLGLNEIVTMFLFRNKFLERLRKYVIILVEVEGCPKLRHGLHIMISLDNKFRLETQYFKAWSPNINVNISSDLAHKISVSSWYR